MKESTVTKAPETQFQHSFLNAFKEFVHRHELIARGDKIIVAVSGGIDSMVLLDLLLSISKDLKLELSVAHFNHELRGNDADEDEAFIRAKAKQHGLECYVEHANTKSVADAKKLTIQQTARDLRYKFFNKLRTSRGYQKVATAHHADDNAETIMFNLFRGAGVQGLSGIPVMRNDIAVIRPLLFAPRTDIEEYARLREVAFREDTTNSLSEYTRNFLRHQIVPLIKENINPNIAETLRRTSELFDQLEQFLIDTASSVLVDVMIHRTPDQIVFDLQKFHHQPVFLQEHILLHMAKEFSKLEIDFTTVKTMLKISHAETGTSCSISKDVVFFRDRDHLVFRHVPNSNPFQYRIAPDKSYEFEFFKFHSATVPKATMSDNPFIEYIDASALGKELLIRSWNEGDWFVPLGMKEKKKISDFFIDQKIPLFEKQTIPIVISDGSVVWICGKRLDDRYKITPKTTSVIKLEYVPR